MYTKANTIVFILFLLGLATHAQVLVADLNQENEGSFPEKIVVNEEVLAFFGEDDIGRALFKMDQRSSEPVAIHYINSSDSRGIVWDHQLINNDLYFITGTIGCIELHKINLATNNYLFLGKLAGSPGTWETGRFTPLGKEVFFTASGNGESAQLWKIDTLDQLSMIKEFPSYILPKIQLNFNNKLILGLESAWPDVYLGEIWASDGTKEGTQLIMDIKPGRGGYNYRILDYHIFGAYFYVWTYSSENGYEVWQSDGTTAGTAVFRPNIDGVNNKINRFEIFDGRFLFVPEDTIPGTQLYEYLEGTETAQLILNQQETPEISQIGAYFYQDDLLFFEVEDTSQVNSIWRSDGTPEGTFLLQKIKLIYDEWFHPNGRFQWFQNELYFIADDGITGAELWKTDGTIAGTHLVKDAYPGKDGIENKLFTIFNDQLYFDGLSLDFGKELWSTDGSEAGTQVVKDLNPNTSKSSSPLGFYEFNDALYFTAFTRCLGRELFKTMGTSETTKLVKDINPGRQNSDASTFFKYNTQLHFLASNAAGERPFWSSDGTKEGTKEAFSLSRFISPQVLDDELLFKSFISGKGAAILKFDSTQAGTEIIKVIGANSAIGSLIKFSSGEDSVLIFDVNDPILGQTIWRTDGTTEGTFAVKNLPNEGDIIFHEINYRGGVLFSVSNAGGGGQRLWKSDGTPEGTIPIGPYGGVVGTVVVHNDFIYFTTIGYGENIFYRSDGTSLSYERIVPSGEGADLQYLCLYKVFDDKIFFVGYNEQYGYEPWYYDMNQETFVFIKDIWEGPKQSAVYDFVQIGDYLCFNANDGIHGLEPWITDGTKENTRLIKDLRPGPMSSRSHWHQYYLYKDFLYFEADDGLIGSELYKFSPYDQDNDGYLPPEDLDDKDPLINVENPSDPFLVEVACVVDSLSTSTHERLALSDVSIFPNPVKDWFQLRVNTDLEYIVNLFTPNGQQLLLSSSHNGGHSYNLSYLPSGHYLVQLRTPNGELLASKILQKL
ncbi:MAG: hypothetical protein Sapg2KO_37390 [Saprospiraceae bacterium]